MPEREFSPDYDVVIAGGGPAGLAAALLLGRVRRRVLVCDTGQGRNATVQATHGFFTRDGTTPGELLGAGRDQLQRYPSVQIREVAVDGLQRNDDGGFVAALSDGRRVTTRRVLLATGLADELPELSGLAEIWGRSAFHCPYCDGWETQGKTVAVLADGAKAVRLALQLVRFTPDLVVCTNGETTLDEPARNLLTARGITLRSEPIARLDHQDGQLRALELTSGEIVACQLAFVAAPYRQRSDLAARLGCALLDDDTVQVNDFGQTTVPGVYAAGDMARKETVPVPLAQIMFAATSGQLAAAVIDQELLLADIPDFPSPLRQSAPGSTK